MNLSEILEGITALDENAMERARERQRALAKPMGSLGALEDISIQMAGITGKVKNSSDKKIIFLFGADNGVYEEGIAATPQHFTRLLMSYYGEGKNCAINVICRHNNVELQVIDIGALGKLDYTYIKNERLMSGTDNFYKKPAMPREIAKKAILVGLSYAKYACENGYSLIGGGEVGMGNTTTAAACIMAALGIQDCDMAVGRGAGLTDEAFLRKKHVIAHGLELHKPRQGDAVDILSKVGGLDIAALVGLYVGAAYYKIPIVMDGVISAAAALLAVELNPLIKGYIITSHASEEPAYLLVMKKLGLVPMLNLGMRLGEGSGCPIAMGVVENALAVMNEMSTFEEVSLETDYRSELKMK